MPFQGSILPLHYIKPLKTLINIGIMGESGKMWMIIYRGVFKFVRLCYLYMVYTLIWFVCL